MPSKPFRPCKHTGCIELTRDGYCPVHKPAEAARRLSANWHRFYDKPIWKHKLRPQQLIKEPYCRLCAGEGYKVKATTVDHITPHRGDWELFIDANNLQSLCKRHHDIKTQEERRAGR